MTTSRDKPLSQWTRDEINESLRANAPHIVYSMKDLATELERRATARQNRVLLVSTIAAAVAAIASAIAALASLAKP